LQTAKPPVPPPPPPPIQQRPVLSSTTAKSTTHRRLIASSTARITTSTTARATTTSGRPPPPPSKQPSAKPGKIATPPPYNVQGGVDFSRIDPSKEEGKDKSEWTPIAEEEFVLHREPVGEAVVSTLQDVIDSENVNKLPSRSYSSLGQLRPMPTLFPAKRNSTPEPSSTTTTTTTTTAVPTITVPAAAKEVDSPFFMLSLSSLPPPPPPAKQKISATYKQEDISSEKPILEVPSAVLTNTHIRIKESDRRLNQDPIPGSMKIGGILSESRGNQEAIYKPVTLISATEKVQNVSETDDEKFVKVPSSLNNSASIPVYIVHSTEKTTLEPEPIFTIEMTEEEPTVPTALGDPEEEQTESFTEEISTTLTPEEEIEDTKQPSDSKVGPTLSSLLLKPLTASQRTAEVDNMSPIKAGLLFREPKSGPSSSAIKDSVIQGFPKNEFNSAPAFLRRNNTIKKTTTLVTTTVKSKIPKIMCIYFATFKYKFIFLEINSFYF